MVPQRPPFYGEDVTWRAGGPGGAVDDVTRAVLGEVVREPDVVRAALALSRDAGRRLEFLPSERLAEEPLPWCEIDSLADVPVVNAILTGRPVTLGDLDALAAAYPHLVERQQALGTRALLALPLLAGEQRLGAVLVSFGAPQPFSPEQLSRLTRLADRAAAALRAAQRTAAAAPAPRPAAAGEVSVVLDPTPSAPRAARTVLREHAGRWELDDETLEAAQLAVSEVVTNALIHSGTAIRLDVAGTGGVLRVEVTDGGSAHPGVRPVPRPTEQDAVGGRGLLVVDALTSAWGSRGSGEGTTVWFEMPLGTPAGVRRPVS